MVVSTDVIQIRRFATGLDSVNGAFNEAQRADCAPRASAGDGNINSGDVVQARRYATGLDPLTEAAGPAAPAPLVEERNALIADGDYDVGREIRVGTAVATARKTVTVPIEMRAYGDEMAASFTLEYDRAKLANPRLTLGDASPDGSVLTVNSNEAGRIGILIDSTSPFTASAMPRTIILITFEVHASGETPIVISGTLAPQGTADSDGNMVFTKYVGGIVEILKNSELTGKKQN
jgi:hypothetical protein